MESHSDVILTDPLVEGYLYKLKQKPSRLTSPWTRRYFTIEECVEGSQIKGYALAYYSDKGNASDHFQPKKWVVLDKITHVETLSTGQRALQYLNNSGNLQLSSISLKQLLRHRVRVWTSDFPMCTG
eukprot:gb/GECG01006019.1/.p1 GENE.gb/GECG01006019.1/~~gb/GECG01006019.1/.p1  ORF type:complete len:127 (+),score=14.00 gb/GECG01006019.1/:1-381(+)